MKKILNIFIVLLIVFVTASCNGVSQKWPVTVKLDKENVLDYIFMDVSYDEVGEDILIETRAASDLYTFSPYSGFYIYLNCDTIFDYEERRNSYKVYVSLNPDGTCEVDDNLNKNAMAMVFNNVEVYGAVDGSVIINGNATNVVNGHVFSTNEEQQNLYDAYSENIPKPGDETYGSKDNLYRYNNYSDQTGLALYSVNGGNVICASRSFKHNNDKVTEIGDGGPLCEYTKNGIYHNCNEEITSIKLSKYTEKINESAFSQAKSLRTIEFPSTLKYIGRQAFQNASLADGVQLPDGLEYIGTFAFASTKLKVIFIPATVTTIEEYAFKYCDGLVIYCEASSKPDGWSHFWDNVSDSKNLTVIWGASRSDAN